MRFGWVEWDEVIGPNGRVYADERLLPTIGVYWTHRCRNTGQFDPRCGSCGEAPQDEISVFFALENQMFCEMLVSVRQGCWSIDMALLPEFDPVEPHRSGWSSTCYGVDRSVALCRHDCERPIHFEDPEDYADVIRILARWSSLEKCWVDQAEPAGPIEA